MLIALLPGDGVGPEVMAEAVRVLGALGHFELATGVLGGAAIDRTGSPLPSATLDLCRKAEATLLIAVGGPKWDNPSAATRPEEGLLRLRRELGLYANLRPVKPLPGISSPIRPDVVAGTDLVIVRELTGGLYFGEKHFDGNHAQDVCSYSAGEIDRIARVAFQLARSRRKRLVSVDKANVLATSRLWRATVTRVGLEFPDVVLEHALVDSTAMKLVQKPASFDVILTENMFGDILSDEASVLAGSIGLLPSASLGEGKRGLYEPVHGSAPDIAWKGIANPYGTFLSVAMMLRHSCGMEEQAVALEEAVNHAIRDGVLTPDLGGNALTRDAGDAVLRRIHCVRAKEC